MTLYQSATSKSAESGEGFEERLLTSASEWHEDGRWRALMQKLESAQPSYLEITLELAVARLYRSVARSWHYGL